jgi:hypothetical protein
MKKTLLFLLLAILCVGSALADGPNFGTCDKKWTLCAKSGSFRPGISLIDRLVIDGAEVYTGANLEGEDELAIRPETQEVWLSRYNQDSNEQVWIARVGTIQEPVGEDSKRSFAREFRWDPSVQTRIKTKKSLDTSCSDGVFGAMWYLFRTEVTTLDMDISQDLAARFKGSRIIRSVMSLPWVCKP